MNPPNAQRPLHFAFQTRLGGFNLDVSFSAPAQGVTVVYGPSGCGKTSLLRCIAGLQRAPAGHCEVGGDIWQNDRIFVPTHLRSIGYVFQEASLFSHLSVRKNLDFGLRMRGQAHEGAIDFDETIDLLALAPLLDRAPQKLSGGERQRVAIARALLSQPKLLLMDEPLAALDRAAKDEILPFLERLHARLSLPILYVSHDIAEVERLADHLVLLDQGRVQASGALQDIQSNPALPLANARDASIILDCAAERYDAESGLLTLKGAGGQFLLPGSQASIGQRYRLRIAAGDVSLALEPQKMSTILNCLPARITGESRPIGAHEIIVVLALGEKGDGAKILARITQRSWRQLSLCEGLRVYAQIKGVALAPGRHDA